MRYNITPNPAGGPATPNPAGDPATPSTAGPSTVGDAPQESSIGTSEPLNITPLSDFSVINTVFSHDVEVRTFKVDIPIDNASLLGMFNTITNFKPDQYFVVAGIMAFKGKILAGRSASRASYGHAVAFDVDANQLVFHDTASWINNNKLNKKYTQVMMEDITLVYKKGTRGSIQVTQQTDINLTQSVRRGSFYIGFNGYSIPQWLKSMIDSGAQQPVGGCWFGSVQKLIELCRKKEVHLVTPGVYNELSNVNDNTLANICAPISTAVQGGSIEGGGIYWKFLTNLINGLSLENVVNGIRL